MPDHAGFRGLLARWFHLLRSWWQVDRVRVSPVEGRLLRLHPPCIIRINGRYVQVISRRCGQTPRGPYVTYVCDVNDQPGQLHVEPMGQHGCPIVRWKEADSEETLEAREVEVFE